MSLHRHSLRRYGWAGLFVETFFLAEEKRSIRTQNFHRKNTFHDLFTPTGRMFQMDINGSLDAVDERTPRATVIDPQ
jgi:hypothetical protein